MKKLGILIVAIIIVVVAAKAFSGSKNETASSATPSETESTAQVAPAEGTVPTEPASTGEEAMMDKVHEVTVTAKNFSFTPATITVKKGEKVKLTVKSTAGTHDFRIDELNVATKQIAAGQENMVEFTADKIGSFEFYCSVADHRAKGMKGTLMVE